MAELDLDALEQAAREAGGGCWFSAGWTVGSRGFEVGDLKSRDRICSDATARCAEFVAAANPATILELLDRLKAAEKSDAESLAMYRRARDERDTLRAALQHESDCVEAAKAEIKALRAKIEEMEKTWLSPEGYHILMQEREDILFRAEKMKQRAPCKDISMWPTHHTQPTQPAPSVPDGFSREDLEAVADGLDGYEKTVNVGNVTGGGDDHLESTTAYAARFIRAMLAAAPEAKP